VPESVFQIRYTVPGLTYFTVTYLCLVCFFPDRLFAQQQNMLIVLGGIAVVGTIPAGYLINQIELLREFLVGRYEGWGHIQELRNLVFDPDMDDRSITLYLDRREINVRVNALRSELMSLGKVYLEKVLVLAPRSKRIIKEGGLLGPLHDVIFVGNKAHSHYLRTGWLHSNATASVLLALTLAVIPWVTAACHQDFSLAQTLVFFEFLVASVAGLLVYIFTRADSDLKERFLTWLYEQLVRNENK